MLKPRDLAWEKQGVLNAGVTIYDGRILLLYRAVGDDHVSRFGVATTTDGVTFSYPSDQPVFAPDPANPAEALGVEDARVTFLGDRYGIVYVGAAAGPQSQPNQTVRWQTRVSLAFTTDFQTFDRRGVIMDSYNDKDACLFPVQFGDYWYLYHRRLPSIWLSKTLDFRTLEDVCSETCMVVTPELNRWDNDRIGIAAPPLYTDDGWVVFYHGRSKEGVYRLSAFLADLAQPDKILARLPYPLLEPQLPFETQGIVPNVVFSCGAVEIGDAYWVYYGGADYAIGGAWIKKSDLLGELKQYIAKPALVAVS